MNWFRRINIWERYAALLIIVGTTCLRAEFGNSNFAQNGVFGRQNSSFFNNLGGLFVNGKFNLTLGFPQDLPFFSRLSQPLNNSNEQARRVLIRDPRSGFITQEARLAGDGVLETRATDAFGRPFSNFFNRGGLDSEAYRQAAKFFLESDDLGDFNNIEKLFNGQINLNDAFAANALAVQELGPDLTRGTVKIQCAKDDANGQPTDILGAHLNDNPLTQPKPEYLKLNWQDRCFKTMSYTLNQLVDPFHPPISKGNMRIDPVTGIMTISNLRNSFSLRDLAVIFARSDNTDLCNSDPFVSNPIFSEEFLVRQSKNPDIVNKTQGYDPADVNRNFVLTAGVNLALPKQLLGRVGAKQTDLFFIDNRNSGVATSQQSREIRAFQSGSVSLFNSFDTNDRESGVKIGAQQARQTGRNNLSDQQSETFIYDAYGRDHTSLEAAPNKVDGKMALATFAPPTAANSPHAGVTNGMCDKCHDGPAMIDKRGGPYDVVPVAGQSPITNLSSNFSVARQRRHDFLVSIGADVHDEKEVGRFRSPGWDFFERANEPRTQEYVSISMGYPPDAISNLLRRDPRYFGILQVREDGNIDPINLEAGGKCLIKKALGKPGGGAPQPQFAAAPRQPGGVADSHRSGI